MTSRDRLGDVEDDDRAASGVDDQTRRAARLLLGGEPRYTRIEAARLADVPLERADQLWRSLGYPTPRDTDRVFADADVAALRTMAGLREAGITDSTSELALARAVGQAMARLSESQVALLRKLATAEPGASRDPEAAAGSALAAAEPLLPRVESLQSYVWRRHLLAASERMLVGTPNRDGETAEVVVGFVDVAGFTSLTRGLTERRLAEFLETFESGVSAAVTKHGGRVVKTVGDEVMFAADTAKAAANIALDLADRVSDLDGRPDLHTGLALGPALHRLGDLYGTVVNLAARLTALARPGTVLVDRDLAGVLGDDPAYELRRLRRASVRGFSHLQPWLLRRGVTAPPP